MQNLTENLKILEPVSFARGGFAVVHKAILYPEGLFRRRIAGLLSFSDRVFPLPLSRDVAVKFPDVRSFAGGVDTECIADRTKILQRWRREITAGRSVSHPNILPLLGFCENPDPECKEFVGIVLPFCKNGNAGSYLQQHPRVDWMRIVLVSVAAVLFALHYRSSPVVHGDIKASNILIDEHGDPLLADFGLSRVCNAKGFTAKCIMGSIRWMSVELLRAWTASSQNGTSEDDQIISTTKASDIWAFAMTILEVLTGKLPFAEYNFDPGVIVGVVSLNARPGRPHDQVNDALWILLEHCWVEEPAARPGARHVGLALDIIYGFGRREVDSHTVSAILAGALDNVVPQSSQSQRLEPALLPYQCKWLHCSRSFDRIDDCVEHECVEFTRRGDANGR